MTILSDGLAGLDGSCAEATPSATVHPARPTVLRPWTPGPPAETTTLDLGLLPSLLQPADGPSTAGAALPAAPALTAEAAADLRLDEIAAALAAIAGHPLDDVVFQPLRDRDAVAYRQEVFADLADEDILRAVRAAASGLALVRERLGRARAIRHRRERSRWLLDAADAYRSTAADLARALSDLPVRSRALSSLSAALREHVASEPFRALVGDTDGLLSDLESVVYRLRITDTRITVGRDVDEPDLGAEVAATFARFRRPDASPVMPDVFSTLDMNSVETAILDRVARLHPAVFAALDRFAAAHPDPVHPLLAGFEAEIAFYLAWVDLLDLLRRAGVPTCLPTVAAEPAPIDVRGLYDLALALQLAGSPGSVQPASREIVRSDLALHPDERIVVVTGPIQAGKTTFARAIGQLAHLAAIGCPVPASSAALPLTAVVRTHLARPEDPDDLTGRLEADLLRLRDSLDPLAGDGLLILDEAFASTTVADALVLERASLAEVAARGARCVTVTFLDELADEGASTVSLAAVTDPADATQPSYRFERRRPAGFAHATALAARHGLDYATVRERLAR